MRRALAAIALLAALAAAGWVLRPAPDAGTASLPASTACSLLTDAEIEAQQGEKPVRRTDSRSSGSGLVVSQCYYGLPTAARSISLTLTERDPGAAGKDPGEAWEAMFKSGDAHPPAQPIEKVPELGDEALWLGNPVGGAIYVRAKGRILRISIGGVAAPADRRDRTIALARAVVGRL